MFDLFSKKTTFHIELYSYNFLFLAKRHKFVFAMPLMSICLVKVFARFIHRREAVEKLVESKVAVPFLLKSWRSDDPIGSTITFVNGVLSSLPGI